jgi:hypothetical protein
MPSPFPGMDPYLEQEVIWHDFQERFLPAAAAQISAQVLPRYIVLIGESVYLEDVEVEQDRDALPTIPVPLLAGEPDARLDLRAVIDRAYEEAGYRYFVYDSDPEPPLTGSDVEWADRVRSKEPSSGETI